MNRQASRRRATALFALAPAIALGLPLISAAARAPVRPPSGPINLRRVLTRGLADGKTIVVTRTWTITFAPGPGGYIITGEQRSADVAAPPALMAMADFERRRAISGFLPLRLDDTGLIVPAAAHGANKALDGAIETARALIAAVPAEERHDAARFMANLARSGASSISQLPRDLFFPAPADDRVSRDFPLPDGGSGTLTVTTISRAAPGSGFLVSYERAIVTHIADDVRTSSELWETRPTL